MTPTALCLIPFVDNPEHLRPSGPDQTVILVADDEVLIRNIARITLESDGYFVLEAGDGEEALAISRQYPGVIHAVLSDVQMPNLDGFRLRERILAERPGIKVMLMSGTVEVSAENVAFLRKPFSPTLLKERLRQLLISAASV